MLKGRILITGGAGFLGRAIIRRIEREAWPVTGITVYSRDEQKQDVVGKRWPDVRRVLGDVQNFDRLSGVLSEHRYDLIIHAGAVKRIPEAEDNVLETVDVNINGSRQVAMAAIANGVPTVVGLSTDKAAAPLNTYGMTKAVMERMYGEMNRHSPTRFACVRYGNVVSSSGSVIPLFREQYARARRVKITSPAMTRFWLTNDDAIDMIGLAAALAPTYPGGVFVPRCGAMRITQTALAATGADPASDFVEYIGLRPGEKLHETLVIPEEMPRTIRLTRDIDYGHGSGVDADSRYSVFVVNPPASPLRPVAFDETDGYSSDAPDDQVAIQTMKEWITDAEKV